MYKDIISTGSVGSESSALHAGIGSGFGKHYGETGPFKKENERILEILSNPSLATRQDVKLLSGYLNEKESEIGELEQNRLAGGDVGFIDSKIEIIRGQLNKINEVLVRLQRN